MDREIPKEVRNKERNKKIIRYGGMGAAGIVVISVLISLMRTGVKEKDIVFSQVSTGTIEVSVSASGKVVPAFEEIINSPINTRILEVYKKGGDSVDIGTPILKLDLQSAETDYKQKLDEEQMRSYKLKQLKLENMTKLTKMTNNDSALDGIDVNLGKINDTYDYWVNENHNTLSRFLRRQTNKGDQTVVYRLIFRT